MFTKLLILILSLFISVLIWFLVGLKWDKCCGFFSKKHNFLDFSFIFLYFIEQVLLSALIYLGYNPQIVAGISSLILITTASIQNKCSEIREQNISKTSTEQSVIIKDIMLKQGELISENIKLKNKLDKSKSFINEVFSELEKFKLTLKKKK